MAGPPYARFIALAALVSHGVGLHRAGHWLRCRPCWPSWIRAASQVLAWGPGKQARASPAAKKSPGPAGAAARAAQVASDSSHRYGVLAVADTRPRPGGLAPEQTTLLQQFAGVAVQELEREKVGI